MRIAMFAGTFHPERDALARSLLASARALWRRGHAVLLAVPRYPRFDPLEDGGPDAHEDEGISVLRLPTLPLMGREPGRAVIPTALGALRCRTWRPDVVHAHLPFGAGLEALATSRLLRIPLIGTHHGPTDGFVRHFPALGARLAPVARQYVRWYYDRCDRVTSPSRELIAAMRRDGLRAPVSVVANPLSPDGPRGIADRFEPSRRSSLPGFTLLHVGPLTAEARIGDFIHAIPSLLTRIPGVSLALIGRGAAESSLRTLAETLQVSTHVRFLGHATPARLRDAYAASDVFVSMNTAETQSLALIEAMASRLPVIVARSPNLAEHVDTSRGLLVDPGNPAALAEVVVALHRHPARAAALGAAGRVYAAHFSPNRIAAEWEEVYAEVLSPARRRSAIPLAASPTPPSRR